MKKDRFQVSLDLKDDRRKRYEEAMRVCHRDKPELLRVMIDTWLDRWEANGKMTDSSDVSPDLPPPRPKTQPGERAAFKKDSR